jgi:hypothetical protein
MQGARHSQILTCPFWNWTCMAVLDGSNATGGSRTSRTGWSRGSVRSSILTCSGGVSPRFSTEWVSGAPCATRNRAGLNRLAVDVDAGDMLAGNVPKAHQAAVGYVNINRGGRRRAPMDRSRFVRSIGYAGCADPWIFEHKVVVIPVDAVWLRHHSDREPIGARAAVTGIDILRAGGIEEIPGRR